MPSSKDRQGRPTVVVTGRGMITSLGAGKTDNWAKLTGGESAFAPLLASRPTACAPALPAPLIFCRRKALLPR